MDGENNGKPQLKWMIWGAHPYCWKHPFSFREGKITSKTQADPSGER